MKTKKIIICVLLLIVTIAIILMYLFFSTRKEVTFYIDGKEKVSLKNTIEYEKNIKYSPKDIKLTAKKNKKDVSDLIKYKKINIDSLKTYTIEYSINDEIFIYHMKVVDTRKPDLTCETLHLTVGTDFDYSLLKARAVDNFDQDISKQIKYEGNVNTDKSGEYEIVLSVRDSSDNQSKKTIKVVVEETEMSTTGKQEDHSIVENPNDIQALINKQFRLSENWVPNDLVNAGGNYQLRREAATSWQKMQQAASNAGITMNMISAYRTKEYQANLYNNYYAIDPVNAPMYSALPRTSEHELGLAVDVSYDYNLHEDLQNSNVGKWMDKNAHTFGWIMRYPKGKSHITGYIYEAWHYRYIGVSLASELKNKGITLEEYYN